MMNKMLRAIIVAVIISVANFKVIKCDDAKCSEKWLEKNSRKTREMTVNYDALLNGKSIKKTIKKDDNILPFDSEFTFLYNKEESKIEVDACIVIPEKDDQKLLKDLYEKFYPLKLEIVQSRNHKKCSKKHILSPIAIYNIHSFEDQEATPCKTLQFPPSTLVNHTKYFVSRSDMIVKATYFPCYPECKSEYLASEGVWTWNIHPYSQIKWNFKEKIIGSYASPIIVYTSPNAARAWFYMEMQNGQDDEDTVNIGFVINTGPFIDTTDVEAEITLLNDPNESLKTVGLLGPESFGIKKDIIKDDTLKFRIQLTEKITTED